MAETKLFQQKFYYGTLAKVQAAEKNADALYFAIDAKMAFKGDQRILGNFEVISTRDDATDTGVLYVVEPSQDEAGSFGYFNGNEFVEISNAEELDRITALEDAVGVKKDGGDVTESTGLYKEIEDAVKGLLGDASDEASTLGQLEDKIDALDAAKVVLHKLSAEEIAALSDANVKEAYQLATFKTVDGEIIYTKLDDSDTVKIYKDGSLVGVKLTDADLTADDADDKEAFDAGVVGDAHYLTLCYQTEEGKYDIVSIDVAAFLSQATYGDGLAVSEGEVSVKIAEDDVYLGFSENKEVEAKVVAIADAKEEVLANPDEGIEAEAAVTGLADALDVKNAIAKAVADTSIYWEELV